MCEARGVWRGFSNCEISRRARSITEVCMRIRVRLKVLIWSDDYLFDSLINPSVLELLNSPFKFLMLTNSPKTQGFRFTFYDDEKRRILTFLESKLLPVVLLHQRTLRWQVFGFYQHSEKYLAVFSCFFGFCLVKMMQSGKNVNIFQLYVRWQSTLSVHECKVKEKSTFRAIPVQFSLVQQTKT